jgi:hypothetical protein
MKPEIIQILLTTQIQFKILHWQTLSYSRHKAYGEIYDSLNENIDEFVESCQGKYGRFEFTNESAMIKLYNLKTLDIDAFLRATETFLLELNSEFSSEKDSDLLNIRDEMLADLNKLRYLLTLK